MTVERVSKEHGEMVLTGESRSAGGKAHRTCTGQVLTFARSQSEAGHWDRIYAQRDCRIMEKTQH
jgi:hypothetical protein